MASFTEARKRLRPIARAEAAVPIAALRDAGAASFHITSDEWNGFSLQPSRRGVSIALPSPPKDEGRARGLVH